MGRTVISHKRQQKIIRHKKGREKKDHSKIGVGHLIDRRVRPKKSSDPVREKKSHQQIKGRCIAQKQKPHRKDPVGFFLLTAALMDRVLRRTAHSEHQPRSVHKTVDRKGEIECGQSVCTDPLRDKKGVGENVAG